jgi:N-acyl-D-amino-acid deacylase
LNKILIKNGTIVDGTGENRYRADLLIKDNTIDKIGQINENCQNFNRVIDANGMVICPGFIDAHSHSDLGILLDPYVESKIRQGITTEILGQDGVSMAPLPLKYVSLWRKSLSGFEGDSDELSWDWENTDGYLKLLEKSGVGPNVAYLVPHGNIRMEAMGLENRKANSQDIKKMKEIVKREMEAGAAGLSTGLIYMPCVYGDTEEIIELCKVVAEYDRIFAVHQRSEADAILDSMEEIIRIGRESGVKIHYSHFKICGKKNWAKVDKVLELLEKAKAEGIRVSFDQYPYIAGSTVLGVILPPWVHEGGIDKLVERLENKELRKKMVKDIENGIPGWDNFIDFAGFDNIYVTKVKTDENKDCIGKSLTEIAEIRGKNKYDAVFDLLYEEKNAVGMYNYYGKEEHIIKFMKRPEQVMCTDGLLGGKPHPRLYGAFARVLGKYVREEKALTLEEAICKMTLKPAEIFKLNDRGVLKEGKKADIVILNPDTIIDTATFIEPIQYPAGILNVIINGEVVLDNGQRLKAITGNVIRIK